MRIFKTRSTARWAESAGITDTELRNSINRMKKANVTTGYLGGQVYKESISSAPSAYEQFIAYKADHHAFLLYGVSIVKESQRISSRELILLKKMAYELLQLSNDEITQGMKSGALTEVTP